MALPWSALGDQTENALSWLDARHLGRIEAADKGMVSEVTRRCWEKLAMLESRIVDRRPWILPKRRSMTAGTGKEVLKELINLRLQLNIIPALQSPDFGMVSFTSLQISPWKLDEPPTLVEMSAYANLWADAALHVAPPTLTPLIADSTPLEDDRSALVPTNVDVTSSEEHDEPPPLIPPAIAIVPLSLGANVGEKMSIGVQIHSAKPSAHEGVWFGLEILYNWVKVLSVFCAPLTGRFMIERMDAPNKAMLVVSERIPPLEDKLCRSVDIYVTVSESGDVQFVRTSSGSNCVARSGLMTVPPWASQVFAAVRVQRAQVLSETTISTMLPVQDMLQVHSSGKFEVDAASTAVAETSQPVPSQSHRSPGIKQLSDSGYPHDSDDKLIFMNCLFDRTHVHELDMHSKITHYTFLKKITEQD